METTIQRARFPVTNWERIHDYQHGSSTLADRALSEICELYWYPLYAYARRCGNAPSNAEDLTQGFFEQLLSKESLKQVDQDDWKLRRFLLSSMKHYMLNKLRKERTARRYPGKPLVSIDQAAAEERYRFEPADCLTPDLVYERHWVITLLKRVGNQLREEYVAQGKGDLHNALRGFLSHQKPDRPYSQVAHRFGMTKNCVAVTAHRMRVRFRELLRQEVLETVRSREEVDAELDHLLQILASE